MTKTIEKLPEADASKLLTRRGCFSRERLERLRGEISGISELKDLPNLCIYVTGSYGRHEASEFSDCDLFFIYDEAKGVSIPRLNKVLIDSDIIKACREMGFPEFSDDGEYLEIHSLQEIKRELGGRHDDYKNYFTARLLLLLESKPLYNSKLYNRIVSDVIDAYYRDYHNHEDDFRPIFVVNDIIRFWRTLCLNYEHKRNREPNHQDDELAAMPRRNKSHLKNLKLKFSRLLTCFSGVLILSRNRHTVKPEELRAFVEMTPLERLTNISEEITDVRGIVSKLRANYAWFLHITEQDSTEMLEWVGNKENRESAFECAREFGKDFYQLLDKSVEKETMRFLVI